MKKIADQPQAEWIGEWSGAVKLFVTQRAKFYEQYDAIGGLHRLQHPRSRLRAALGRRRRRPREVHRVDRGSSPRALDDSRAALILEPDAVPLLEKCTSEDKKAARYELIARAVKILKARENAIVYVDAGNARWVPPEDMAARLLKAGLEYADGFSLNVSNYVATGETPGLRKKISALTGERALRHRHRPER